MLNVQYLKSNLTTSPAFRETPDGKMEAAIDRVEFYVGFDGAEIRFMLGDAVVSSSKLPKCSLGDTASLRFQGGEAYIPVTLAAD